VNFADVIERLKSSRSKPPSSAPKFTTYHKTRWSREEHLFETETLHLAFQSQLIDQIRRPARIEHIAITHMDISNPACQILPCGEPGGLHHRSTHSPSQLRLKPFVSQFVPLMSSHDFPSFMFLIKFVIPWDLRSFLLERGKGSRSGGRDHQG
jgi:hypothetical protein